MADEHGHEHEHAGDEVVDIPQAGGEAGDEVTSGNGDLTPDELEEPNKDDDEGLAHPAARALVTKLRKEAGDNRKKLRAAEDTADELRRELWNFRVSELGVLADPTDLPYDAALLDAPDDLAAAADELVARKPHLRATRITARAGQGEGQGDAGAVSLSDYLRRGA